MIEEVPWGDNIVDRPKHPPKYRRGQLVVAWVRKQGHYEQVEKVVQIKGHLTLGTGTTYFEGVTTYTPPTYMYTVEGVDDGEKYTVYEDDIGRYVPPVEQGWEPKESR